MNLFDQLKRPFPENKVKWRVGNTNAKKLNCKPWEATKGSALAYVDARDVMQRLDEVMGPNNWQCRYPLSAGELLICEVGLNIGFLMNDDPKSGDIALVDNWIWKANGAGDTQVEAEKGKCSDAFKRAAVLWGIGRYLYYLPFAWVDLENGNLKYNPQLPVWATPEGWDMATAKKEARDAGHPQVVESREPQPKATDEQKATLRDYVASGVNARMESYIKKNIDTMKQGDAADILLKLKKEEAG